MLKKDVSNNKEKIIICVLFNKMFERLFVGIKPPEEIIVIDKFNELKALISSKFRITKIERVKIEYSEKILKDCFNVSALLNDIKLVKDFLKLLSKISIKTIIENKK